MFGLGDVETCAAQTERVVDERGAEPVPPLVARDDRMLAICLLHFDDAARHTVDVFPQLVARSAAAASRSEDRSHGREQKVLHIERHGLGS